MVSNQLFKVLILNFRALKLLSFGKLMKYSIGCIFVLATVLLSACTGQSKFANVAMRPNEIRNNKMSMIVAKVSIPYSGLFNKSGNFDGYIHVANFENQDKKKTYLINGSSYLNSATMIKPGTYYIESIGWSDGLYVYGIKVTSKQLDVKPGECIYIGDIIVVRKSDHTLVFVKNDIPNAIASINASKFDSLAGRLYFSSLIKNESIKP